MTDLVGELTQPNGGFGHPIARPLIDLGAARIMPLPDARGPWSQRLLEALRKWPPSRRIEQSSLAAPADPLSDDDLQLALYVCYELHYSAITGVDERWEWAPSLIAYRGRLEAVFEAAVAEIVPRPGPVAAAEIGACLQELVRNDEGPPLSRYMETKATRQQVIEHVIHRRPTSSRRPTRTHGRFRGWAEPRRPRCSRSSSTSTAADVQSGCTRSSSRRR